MSPTSGGRTSTPLEGRLSAANIARTEDGHNVHVTSAYEYNQSGIRTKSVSTTTVDAGAPYDTTRVFLNDGMNPTGDAQVLEELPALGGTPFKSYVIGDDVLGQADSAGTKWFADDGHGSTRLLTDTTGTITDRMSYDAYGVMLAWHGEAPGEARRGQPNVTNPVSTDLTYSGEQFDAELGMGYNRARYYAMTAGVWNRLDPYSGNPSDPLSLHKYAYCHTYPANGADPAGTISLAEICTVMTASTNLRIFYRGTAMGATVSGAFRLIVGMAEAHEQGILGSRDFWLDPGLWRDVLYESTKGAIVGGVSSLIGLPYLEKIRRLGGLRNFFTLQALLSYVFIPSALKAIVGTAVTIYDDVVLSGHQMWSVNKIAGVIVFSTAFNFIFDTAQGTADLNWSGRQIARANTIFKELDRPYRIFMNRTQRANVPNTLEVARLIERFSAAYASLGWMSGGYASFVFQLSQKLAKHYFPVRPSP